MALSSWFGIGTNKSKKENLIETDTEKETKQDNDENSDDGIVDMKWFEDIVEGSNSAKGDKQILSKLWQQITGENMISRLLSPNQRYAGKIWGKLCHRCDISYPPCSKLNVIDLFDADNISEVNLIRYAVRHAVASYPPSFVVFLGLKADLAYAFKSTKKLLLSAFGIESKDVIIDNCTNNLILPNNTHQPSFYLCVDHKQLKIIISIRGSSSLSDALTDVNAIAKEYAAYGIDGYVHEGIMASTRFVFDKVTKNLVLLCNQYKNYQVIITGHSLGGGVAALLGFMYNNHPIICKQNNLKVYAFASPCVISKEFTDKNVGLEYITTIILSTDLVTRLSLESVKQQNRRLDEIMNIKDTSVFKQCMVHLKDKEQNDDMEEEEHKEDDSQLLIQCLKKTSTPNPKDQLFPIGRILWLVPKAAMDNDDVRRRKNLMCLKDKSNSNKKKYKTENLKGRRLSDIWSQTWHNMTVSFEEFQDTMDNAMFNGAAKSALKYDGSNYILCEANNCRSIFQELVLDLPESLFSHFPSRYIWACDAHLTRGHLHAD